jgi:hypothetical protein
MPCPSIPHISGLNKPSTDLNLADSGNSTFLSFQVLRINIKLAFLKNIKIFITLIH